MAGEAIGGLGRRSGNDVEAGGSLSGGRRILGEYRMDALTEVETDPKRAIVAITGATGFLGSHLTAHLVASGFRVRTIDRRAGPTRRNVAGVVVADWTNAAELVDAMSGAATLIHLAARVDPMRHPAANTAAFQKDNAELTERVLHGAAAAAVGAAIVASSIKAVAECSVGPLDESCLARPVGEYGRSKLAAERAANRVSSQTGLSVAVLRLPLVYGRGMKGNMLALVRLVDRGWPLPVGALSNRRSVLYVGNFVRAVAEVVRAPMPGFRVYNVADRVPVSTKRLVEWIAAGLGKPARVFAVPGIGWRLLGPLGRSLAGSLEVDTRRFRETYPQFVEVDTAAAVEAAVVVPSPDENSGY